MRKERWVISGDWHLPFHDPRLIDLVLDVSEDIGCTHFLINGDFCDMYSINFHGPKNPRVQECLETEIESGIDHIYKIKKKLPKAKIHLSFGNHDQRLERFILKYAKAFWNMFKLENMFELEANGITWTPYQEVVQIPDVPIYITHSPPSYSKHAAGVSLEKKGEGNWIFSCTHRPTYAQKNTALGSVYECFTMGWLGSTNLTESHKEVFSFTKGHHEWGHSFTIVDVVGEDYFISHIVVRNYKCVVDGFVYEG